MRTLLIMIVALTLFAGCAVVPLAPYHGHGSHYGHYHNGNYGHGNYGHGR